MTAVARHVRLGQLICLWGGGGVASWKDVTLAVIIEWSTLLLEQEVWYLGVLPQLWLKNSSRISRYEIQSSVFTATKNGP